MRTAAELEAMPVASQIASLVEATLAPLKRKIVIMQYAPELREILWAAVAEVAWSHAMEARVASAQRGDSLDAGQHE